VKSTMLEGLSQLSRPRRFSIVDLMVAVALAALGMTLVTLVDRSELKADERSAYDFIAALALLSLYCQWPLSSLRASDQHSWLSAILGIFPMFLAVASFVCVGILSAALAE
jgi:hypothetical protein